MLPAATEHYRTQQQRARLAVLLARREWGQIGDDFDAGWQRVGPRLALLVGSAQRGAATDGVQYVGTALAAQGQAVRPEARVNPAGLAGIASDGRPLETLLYGAIVNARSAKVDTLPQRLEAGSRWLDLAVHSQVADAGRDGAKLAMTVRPNIKYVRFVNPPCCQRCAALGGEAIKYSRPFQRHPRCDCLMVPTTVANPAFAGEKLTAADVTDLTRKQKDALADGANFHSTINDYQRKRGDYSGYTPPTRVDQVIDRAAQRQKAMDALAQIGLVIP